MDGLDVQVHCPFREHRLDPLSSFVPVAATFGVGPGPTLESTAVRARGHQNPGGSFRALVRVELMARLVFSKRPALRGLGTSYIHMGYTGLAEYL